VNPARHAPCRRYNGRTHAFFLLVLFGAWLGVAAPALALNATADAVAKAHRDLVAATADLNAARDAAASERLPLVEARNRLAAEVAELRRRADALRVLRRQGEGERAAVAAEAAAREEEVDFILAALQEYRRSVETRISAPEAAAVGEPLSAIDAQLTAADDYAALPQAAASLFALASEGSLARAGGQTLAGACLDAAGLEQRGRFAVFGPAVYFASDGGGMGLAVSETGHILPALAPVQDIGDVSTVVHGGEATLAVDVTGGDAVRVAASRESLIERLRSGGVVMVPIGAIGLLAAVLVVWKLVALKRVGMPSESGLEPVLDALRRGETARAETLTAALASPFGAIVREGIEHRAAPPEMLDELLHERVMAVLPTLDRHLGTLAVLGGVAPLLGLLGTVTGMIHTFKLITLFGTGDARLLSGGIAEALLTTEAGLVIAVPVMLVHALLSRRVRTIMAGLDQAVTAFVRRLNTEGGSLTTPAATAGREAQP
jgi:biopolymer transport protein ExbB